MFKLVLTKLERHATSMLTCEIISNLHIYNNTTSLWLVNMNTLYLPALSDSTLLVQNVDCNDVIRGTVGRDVDNALEKSIKF